MNKELQKLLLSKEEYVIEATLNKNLVGQLARNYDTGLLNILQSNESVKNHFFTETEGGLVFKLEVFLQFLNNKAFLPDSYTIYKQKIGLANKGEVDLLSQNKEVVLNWPYKDCVLEGGQNKEEVKRQEIFFNEILAPTEINRLLDNKVYVNFKMYDENGEHVLSEIPEESNLVIKGNNLLVLENLKSKFHDGIRLIYIDVPYFFNKTKEIDAFKYNSNFKMSTWLVFLKNRLQAARKLLKDNGSIWIHVGENGMHALKLMADEIFGADHFVGTIPRKTRNGKSDVPFNMSQDFDWILVYTRGDEGDEIVGRQVERKYIETPDFPGRPWRTADLTKQTTIQQRPNSDFTMINPKTGKEYPVNPKRSWAVAKDTFLEWYDKGGIGFPDDYEFMNGNRPFRRVFKDEDDAKAKASAVYSDFLMKLVDGETLNKQGNDEIDELFGRDGFDYAKPEKLMMEIIKIASNEGDYVLDFFSGSGTTAAVAHKLGRKYIAIEQMDYISTVIVPRLQKVIEGEQGGVSAEVDWQGGGSFVYCEIKNDAQDFVNRIDEAETTKRLVELFELAKKSSFISYRVDPKKLKASEFEKLTFAEQKQLLREIIDNNNLYVNYSDIDDTSYGISDEDKALNRQFYGDGE